MGGAEVAVILQGKPKDLLGTSTNQISLQTYNTAIYRFLAFINWEVHYNIRNLFTGNFTKFNSRQALWLENVYAFIWKH